MEFVDDVVDYGNALEISVSGICAIERISRGQVRVSYYSTFRTKDGRRERRIVVHHVWDVHRWMTLHDVHSEMRRIVENGVEAECPIEDEASGASH